eukprot:335854-Ditylum_brightwellii.AAC.1
MDRSRQAECGTNDGIFAGPSNKGIDEAIQDLKRVDLDIKDRGQLDDYLGLNIAPREGKIHLTQQQIILQVLNQVGIKEKQGVKSTLVASTKILQRDHSAPLFNEKLHCQSVIGKVNYLERCIRPDITYTAHQYTRFCKDLCSLHSDTIIHLAKYLASTKDTGLILDPKAERSFRVHTNADFVGNWYKPTATNDAGTTKSRFSYVVSYAGCLIIWAFKLQTQVVLNTCEAEYVALLTALHDVILMMQLLEEMQQEGI